MKGRTIAIIRHYKAAITNAIRSWFALYKPPGSHLPHICRISRCFCRPARCALTLAFSLRTRASRRTHSLGVELKPLTACTGATIFGCSRLYTKPLTNATHLVCESATRFEPAKPHVVANVQAVLLAAAEPQSQPARGVVGLVGTQHEHVPQPG